MVTYDARYTYEIESRIAVAQAASNKKNTLFTSKLDLNFGMKLVKCYIWNIALCGTETWTLQKVDEKYLGRFESVAGEGWIRSVGLMV